jgi:phosphoesterase RecJ-like protein
MPPFAPLLMKENCRLEEIADVLRSRQRFVIMSHVRPDGDAYGCELAMAHCLRQMGKDVTVWNEDGMTPKYSFLPGSKLLTKPTAEPQEFEVALALDTAVQNRLGTCLQSIKRADLWINIDHHVSNDRYGDMAYIDPVAPAAGQILFELFRSQDLPLTYQMADNLYIAILTDTGCFTYPNTTARTYEIGAELVKLGVNVGKLSQDMYENNPRRRLELLRALLNVLKFTSNDKVASFALSLETAQSLAAEPEDNEGLIDHIRSLEGVIVAAFFEELPGGKIRISLRSKDPRADVCKVCAQFGGGGHTLAAGARLTGTLAEAQERVLAAIDREVATL